MDIHFVKVINGAKHSNMSASAYPDSNSVDDMEGDNKSITEDSDEYVTQYLGFTPSAFTNGLYNAYLDYLTDGMNAMGEFLLEKFPDLVTQEEIKQGIDGILKAAQTPMGTAFDKVEKYIVENIFKIPENVVLPEDRVQLNGSHTKKDEIAIDKDIKELREKILAAKYENSVIHQDLKKMETVRTTQTYVLHQFDQLHKILADVGAADLNGALSSTCSHTKKLLEALKETDVNDSQSIQNHTEINDSEEMNELLKIHREKLE